MAELYAFQKCNVELDMSRVPGELLGHAAFAPIEEFLQRFEAEMRSSGVVRRGVIVRPIPSPALLAAIQAPGAFSVEVDCDPVVVPTKERN